VQLLTVIQFSGVLYLRTWCRCGSHGRTGFLYHCTDPHLPFPSSSSISLLLVIGCVFAGLADVLRFCVIVLTNVSHYRVARRSLRFSSFATCLSLAGFSAIDAGLLVSISLKRSAGHAGSSMQLSRGGVTSALVFILGPFFLALTLLDMLCFVS